jgi:hypothetical protein
MATNMKLSAKKEKAKSCEGCVYAKSHQLSFQESSKTSKAKKVGKFFHLDELVIA